MNMHSRARSIAFIHAYADSVQHKLLNIGIDVDICMYIYIYICVCTHTYIHIYIYIYLSISLSLSLSLCALCTEAKVPHRFHWRPRGAGSAQKDSCNPSPSPEVVEGLFQSTMAL